LAGVKSGGEVALAAVRIYVLTQFYGYCQREKIARPSRTKADYRKRPAYWRPGTRRIAKADRRLPPIAAGSPFEAGSYPATD
jgi:hypothetical protein